MNYTYHIIGYGSAMNAVPKLPLHHNRKSDHCLFPPTKQTEGRKVHPIQRKRRDNRDARDLRSLYLDLTASVSVLDMRKVRDPAWQRIHIKWNCE